VSDFSEKAKTIGVSLRRGKSRKKPVQNENDGSRAGYEVEHWDDRQDAVVQPKPIDVKLTVRGD
jgi:hypothetical protein